jgi:hypothetical protein
VICFKFYVFSKLRTGGRSLTMTLGIANKLPSLVSPEWLALESRRLTHFRILLYHNQVDYFRNYYLFLFSRKKEAMKKNRQPFPCKR